MDKSIGKRSQDWAAAAAIVAAVLATAPFGPRWLYPKVAPQLGHLRWRRARQKRMPMGKKKMAHMIPKQVKSSSSTPTLRRRHMRSYFC